MSMYTIRPGTCLMCYKEAEAPRACFMNFMMMERVKLCSDKCLEKYINVEKDFKNQIEKSRLKSEQTLKKLKEINTLGLKTFSKDEWNLEDIEELDLEEEKE